jgi:putative endonuclease
MTNLGTEPWWVYFVECSDRSIYIGIAKDVEARYKKHITGKGALYTKTHPPVRILARKLYASKSEALKAEWKLKQLTRLDKWRWAEAHGLKLGV